MLTPQQLPLNSTVSFDVYPSQLLGTDYKRAKVLAFLDAETAVYLGVDTVAMHANVYATLPPTTPNKHDAYPYVKLRLASGEVACIGLAWIRPDTLVLENGRTMILRLSDITPERQQLLLRALSANGFGAVDVEFLS